jgi:hypothetical protein
MRVKCLLQFLQGRERSGNIGTEKGTVLQLTECEDLGRVYQERDWGPLGILVNKLMKILVP